MLETFVLALPRTYQNVEAADGTVVALTISGEAGGKWFVCGEKGQWQLSLVMAEPVAAEVVIPQDLAWRLFTEDWPTPPPIMI